MDALRGGLKDQGWKIIALELVANDLEPGFYEDFKKILKTRVRPEFLVFTKTYGTFEISGSKIKFVEFNISDALHWIRDKLLEFRSHKIALLIAGHGTGKGFKLWDGLELEILSLAKYIPFKIELVILDSCMMATDITSRAFSGYAKYMIAMQDYCPWNGFISPYLDWILTSDIEKTAKRFVDDFIFRAKLETTDPVSASVIDLDIDIFLPNSEEISICRIDPKFKGHLDFRCQTGKIPDSVIYTRSTTKSRSGLNLVN